MMGKQMRTQNEKGQSLMELAISVTFLLILVAGIVDLGRAIFYYLSLRDAAEEGLVYGTIYPTSCNQVMSLVRNNVQDQSLNVDVQIDGGGCTGSTKACPGHTMTIIATQPNFPITMPFIGGFLGSQTLTLRATINGSILRGSCP